MKKRSRIIKQILALSLIFLLSINSFAAIVSDNDGSAFITKQEFEALKSSFKNQINDYNSSIDRKIDGAIASYLAGIRVNAQATNLYDKVRAKLNGDLWFRNNLPDLGDATVSPEIRINLERHYTYNYLNNFESYWGISYIGNTRMLKHNIQIPGKSGVDTETIFFSQYSKDDLASAWKEWGKEKLTSWEWNGYDIGSLGSEYRNVTNKLSKTIVGSGCGWIFHKNPAGHRYLREYALNYWPLQVIDAQCHTYRNFAAKSEDCFRNYYMVDNGLGDDYDFSLDMQPISEYGAVSSGIRVGEDSIEPNSTYQKLNITQIKASDNIDYSVSQWGTNTDVNLFCFEDTQTLSLMSESTDVVDESSFYGVYYTPSDDLLQTNILSGATINYTPVTLVPVSLPLNSFVHEYLSSVVGENVNIGGGVPLLRTNAEDQQVKLEFTFKCRDESGTERNDTIYYKISNKQFVNGDFRDAEALHIADGSVSTTSTSPCTVDIIVNRRDTTLWLNAYAATSGYQVALDTFDLK